MNGKDLLKGMSYIDEKYVEEAKNGALGSGKSVPRRLNRTFLIAAVIAAALLLVGCTVVYVMTMQDLKIGDETFFVDAFSEDGMEYLGTEAYSQQVLTLAGLEGSANYQAAQEWFAFKQNYDPDYAVYYAAKEGGFPEFPEAYAAYNIYSQEMADKLDEIAEKYDLKLLGAPVEARSTNLLREAVGLESVLMPGSGVTMGLGGITYYKGGSFTMAFSMRMPEGEEMWPYDIMGNLYCSSKAYFNTNYAALKDTDDWREWNYTTASGEDVLIVRSPSSWQAWIFCDREDCTMSMMVEAIRETYTQENGAATVNETEMTDRQLEMVADAIDFTLVPRDPDADADLTGRSADNSRTQNGYTVELVSAVTDGYIAYVTLDITAPEGVVLIDPDIEYYHVLPGNYWDDYFEPVEELKNWVSGSGGYEILEDDDGLDNTLTIVFETEMRCEGGEKPFGPDSVWNLYVENLVGSYYDSERQAMREDLLAEGTWQFDITFEDSDFREIELVPEPITTKAVTGWKLDGTDVWEDVEVTSFKLRSFSGRIECDNRSAEFTDYKGHMIYAVMKDGSKIELPQTGSYLVPETPIDLDQLDYVLLGDGTRLTVPGGEA